MMNQQKGTNENLPQMAADKAAEAVGVARALYRHGEVADAFELYDDAFMMLATICGESHPVTLQVQQDYSMHLTLTNMLAKSRNRHLN